MPMMEREVTYIKQDKPEGEILPAFLRYKQKIFIAHKNGEKGLIAIKQTPKMCVIKFLQRTTRQQL